MKQERVKKFFKNGSEPKYIRCYDNGGETFDRYTVVFTGRYRHKTRGEFLYVGMSESPLSPQGFGQHGSSRDQIDRPKYSHLGKKIAWSALSDECKRVVMNDYCYLWDLPTNQVK